MLRCAVGLAALRGGEWRGLSAGPCSPVHKKGETDPSGGHECSAAHSRSI